MGGPLLMTHPVFASLRIESLSLMDNTRHRCHLKIFFKAPHQTTEYFNLIDRFWSNKNFFGNLID